MLQLRILTTVLAMTALGAGSTGTEIAPAPNRNRPQISGIYPHLAFFNDEGECGTGAVVPWAGRLWAITYSPHKPNGSNDKLYEITPKLDSIVRPESVGGTPASRLVHRESQQLFLGPYAIDRERRVRVIPPSKMFGRLTGTARHLFDPAGKVYFATMEEGLYEVDVQSLAVTEVFADTQIESYEGLSESAKATAPTAGLPGCHGKGLYSGHGRLIYANNGEDSEEARRRPDVRSGCLATWDGRGTSWKVVRRNQFTEVTGPGGIYGNENPASDPVWSIGWDQRSLMLMLLDAGRWHLYRLPKASHCYDGAHGWNTEWPRIRDVGQDRLLMTMHGMFWAFPKTFSTANSAGIAPRSTYLKVIGDFCRWGDRLVFGCDDAAASEFLNRRRVKGPLESVGQSNSNLWFVAPSRIDRLGCPLGRGAVWANEPVAANVPSDPYLFQGFHHRGVHLAHDADRPVKFRFELDRAGNDQWTSYRQVVVEPHGYRWLEFPPEDEGVWIRVSVDCDCPTATAQFAYRNADSRPAENSAEFDSLATPDAENYSTGLVRVRGNNRRTLAFAATRVADDEGEVGEKQFYELDGHLTLQRKQDPKALKHTENAVPIPAGVVAADEASAIYLDEQGLRWRFPRGDDAFDALSPNGQVRICREVVTERDLLNLHGTFYELPAENAGGVAKVRPIATHNLRIGDYCSYRGLLVMSGLTGDPRSDDPHVVRSDDGQVSLWVGVIDDLWKLGKPRGRGGPWKNTRVAAGVPSDPYLMTGYDRKTLHVSHDSDEPLEISVEVDVSGDGEWHVYDSLSVPAGEQISYEFADSFSAYWVRLRSSHDATVTGQFEYR